VPFARPKASECNLANRKQIFKISPDINRISGCVSKKRAQKNRFEFFPRGRNRRATIPFRRLERPSRRRFVHFDIRCVRATKKINRFHRTIYIFLPRKERERKRTYRRGSWLFRFRDFTFRLDNQRSSVGRLDLRASRGGRQNGSVCDGRCKRHCYYAFILINLVSYVNTSANMPHAIRNSTLKFVFPQAIVFYFLCSQIARI
jgi:hypothetical protein